MLKVALFHIIQRPLLKQKLATLHICSITLSIHGIAHCFEFAKNVQTFKNVSFQVQVLKTIHPQTVFEFGYKFLCQPVQQNHLKIKELCGEKI